MADIRARKLREEDFNPYLPPGPPPLVFEEFQGINTSTSRPGVADAQMYWCDGFIPIGRRFLRTLYGVGDPITFSDTAPISFFNFINIATTPYCIVIHTDGSVHAVNTQTYTQTEIAPTGTITSPSRLNVGLCQYGDQYLIIVSSQTNGYFIWDGTTFYSPGQSFGSGNVPTGISGTSVEVYGGHVWVSNGASVSFSAPGSVIDFTSGNGGGNFTSSDSNLRVRYVQLKQTNGFLYLIADSSVNYISNVQTSGSPATTSFQYQNADPETGSPWPSTVGTFGRNILFANAFGAHISYGAAVTKISEPLDGVYATVPNFGGLIPSASKAILFGKRCWILLLPIVDPISGLQVNKLMIWDGKVWFTSSQEVSLAYIESQEIDSVLTTWGTDGTSIYPLFQVPSTGFEKIVQSRFWDSPPRYPDASYQTRKTTNRVWGIFSIYQIGEEPFKISLDTDSDSALNFKDFMLNPPELVWSTTAADPLPWTNSSNEPIDWFAAGVGIAVLDPVNFSQNGVLLGITAKTSKADMSIISMMMPIEPFDYRG